MISEEEIIAHHVIDIPKNFFVEHSLQEENNEAPLSNQFEPHLSKRPSIVGSEEQTQVVDNFTDEGDFILSDEADAEIPESARGLPITL